MGKEEETENSPAPARCHSSFLNIEGYKQSAVLPYSKFYDDRRSRLLMYHGMADDNVLFQNSTQVYQSLIEKGFVFHCMDYPGAKHSLNGTGVRLQNLRMIHQ